MRGLLVFAFVAALVAQSSRPTPPPVRIESGRKQISQADNQKNSGRSSPPDGAVSPPISTQPSRSRTTPQTTPIEQQPDKTWKKRFTDAFSPSTWSNWALVFAAGITALIGLKTLGAINQQARIARIGLKASRIATAAASASARAAKQSADTASESARLAEVALHLTERADVLIDTAHLTPDNTLLPTSTFTITFKNFGRTRASNIQAGVSLYPSNSTAGPLHQTNTVNIVGAGDTFNCNVGPMHERLPSVALAGVIAGSLDLKFKTKVMYFDVFGKPHHCTYSGTFSRTASRFVVDENQDAD